MLFLYQPHNRRLPRKIVHKVIYKSWNRSVSGATSFPGSPHKQTITNYRKLGGTWERGVSKIVMLVMVICMVLYNNNNILFRTTLLFFNNNYITYSLDHSKITLMLFISIHTQFHNMFFKHQTIQKYLNNYITFF